MDIKKLQTLVVDALEDVKGQDIVLFDTTHLTSLFDRIAVVSGTSNRQTKALAASVRDKVKEAGGDVVGLEGEDTGEWVLVDLGDMIVHIMQPAIRQYYRLEEIWGDKPVKLGAAKRKSTTEGQDAAAPKTKSKHLAANQEQEDAKPVRERKPAAKKAADAKPAARKPAAKKIPTGATVKVAVSKTAAADAKAAKAAKAAAAPKRATKAAAEGDAPAKKVIRRIKKTEE
ncbi:MULTISPECIES: ribosome silencing factor [Massilia]|jgi:ribosome-associated protein|uniref:Ribosome silencing factor n=1 Tax=Massilia orientalis TaxID=3050128 RepID=A0ACC7MB82_9BURK|nr:MULTISPECIES: ribosome silencing factor [unclassified Massilia]KQY05722.1 iojap family protein [Massilia sp. Root133]KQZ52178.1 iojap family protein [Massilia sp. Root1485]MDN4042063.1 ribosome silencing factor [Massilia sp. YIM B02787]